MRGREHTTSEDRACDRSVDQAPSAPANDGAHEVRQRRSERDVIASLDIDRPTKHQFATLFRSGRANSSNVTRDTGFPGDPITALSRAFRTRGARLAAHN